MSAESLQLFIRNRWLVPDHVGKLARSVYALLAIHADRGTLEYTGGSMALARYLNVSLRTITKTLAELESAGLITCTRRETAHLRPKTWRLNALSDGGSTVLPSEAEQWKQSASTVELGSTNGGTRQHQQQKPASYLQETSNKGDKSAHPRPPTQCSTHGTDIDQPHPCTGCKSAKEERARQQQRSEQAARLESARSRLVPGDLHAYVPNLIDAHSEVCAECHKPEGNVRHLG